MSHPRNESTRPLRIAIAGWPRAGKTTMALTRANRLACVVRHTDDLIGRLDWSAASEEVARWLDEPGPWVIEGVAVSRALRKWRAAHPGEPPPVDVLVYLPRGRFSERTPGQVAMGKGCDTVHAELADWLADVTQGATL